MRFNSGFKGLNLQVLACATGLLEHTMISYEIPLIARDFTAWSVPASSIFRATTSTNGVQTLIMTQKGPLIFS